MERIPPADRIMEDVEFRNWVNLPEVGLVVPVENVEDVKVILKPGKHLTKTEEGIVEVLSRAPNRGHLMPWKELLSDTSVTNPMLHVNFNVSRIRRKLEDREIINNSSPAGTGLGVKAHTFGSADKVRLAFFLYKYFDQEVPDEYLVYMLYEDCSDVRMGLNRLIVAVHRFNNSRLEATRVKIEHGGSYADTAGFSKLTWAA